MTHKKLSLLICFEKDSGGETIATKQVIAELKKREDLRFNSQSLNPLKRTDSFGYFGWIFISIIRWASIIAKTKTLDWVYTTTYTAGVAAAILKPFRNFKICFHYHGSRIPPKNTTAPLFRQATQRLKYQVTYWLHHLLLKAVDLIIVTSQYSKNYLVRSLRIAKSKKIVVVSNGVNLGVFKSLSSKTRDIQRKRMGISKNSKVILVIGRLNPLKRAVLAIEALPLIVKSLPSIILLIAHPKLVTSEEKKYKNKLLKLAKDQGVEKNIVWRQDAKNTSDLYGVSDLTVLLSKLENLPLVMLEAFATKTLFASTPAGAVESYLGDLDSRLLIKGTSPKKVSRKIIELLQLSKKQKVMIISSSYKVARDLSWEKTSEEILRCLSES